MSQAASESDTVSDLQKKKSMVMSNWFLSLRRQPKDKIVINKKNIQRSCADLTENNENDSNRIMKSKFYVPYASEIILPTTTIIESGQNDSVDNLVNDSPESTTSPLKHCISCCSSVLSNNREPSSKQTTTVILAKNKADTFKQNTLNDLPASPLNLSSIAVGNVDNAFRNYSLIQSSEIIKDKKITLSTSSASMLPNTCCIIQQKSEFCRISATTTTTIESSTARKYPVKILLNSNGKIVTSCTKDIKKNCQVCLNNIDSILDEKEQLSEQNVKVEDGSLHDNNLLATFDKDLKYIDNIFASKVEDNVCSNSESCLQRNLLNRLSSDSNSNEPTSLYCREQINNGGNDNIFELRLNGHNNSINNIHHFKNNRLFQGSQHEVGFF